MSHETKFGDTESEGGLLTVESTGDGAEGGASSLTEVPATPVVKKKKKQKNKGATGVSVSTPALPVDAANAGLEQKEWGNRLQELGNAIVEAKDPDSLILVLDKYADFDLNFFKNDSEAGPHLVAEELDNIRMYMADPNPHTFAAISDPMGLGYGDSIKSFVPFGKNIDAVEHGEDDGSFHRVEKIRRKKDKPDKPEVASTETEQEEVGEPTVPTEIQTEESAPVAQVSEPQVAEPNPELTFQQFSEQKVDDQKIEERKPKPEPESQNKKNQNRNQNSNGAGKKNTARTDVKNDKTKRENGHLEKLRREQMGNTSPEEWDALRALFKNMEEDGGAKEKNGLQEKERGVKSGKSESKSEHPDYMEMKQGDVLNIVREAFDKEPSPSSRSSSIKILLEKCIVRARLANEFRGIKNVDVKKISQKERERFFFTKFEEGMVNMLIAEEMERRNPKKAEVIKSKEKPEPQETWWQKLGRTTDILKKWRFRSKKAEEKKRWSRGDDKKYPDDARYEDEEGGENENF